MRDHRGRAREVVGEVPAPVTQHLRPDHDEVMHSTAYYVDPSGHIQEVNGDTWYHQNFQDAHKPLGWRGPFPWRETAEQVATLLTAGQEPGPLDTGHQADLDSLLDALLGSKTGEGFGFTRDKIHAWIAGHVEAEQTAAVEKAVAAARVVAFTEAYDAVEAHGYEPINGVYPEGHIARLLSAATDTVVEVAAAARARSGVKA